MWGFTNVTKLPSGDEPSQKNNDFWGLQKRRPKKHQLLPLCLTVACIEMILNKSAYAGVKNLTGHRRENTVLSGNSYSTPLKTNIDASLVGGMISMNFAAGNLANLFAVCRELDGPREGLFCWVGMGGFTSTPLGMEILW